MIMKAETAVDINGSTQIVGVIGWPVAHSLSPPMHNAAFRHLGLNWAYVPFAVPPHLVVEAIQGLRGLQMRGLNVTIPHKTAVVEYLDEVSETAQILGAVNTIVNTEGHLTGHNTDGPGFLRSLAEQDEQVVDKKVVIIGAGGAARAVALAVAGAGAGQLAIVNRTILRAQQLASLINQHSVLSEVAAIGLDTSEAAQTVSSADIIIDCTPVGMHPHENVPPVVPAQWLQPHQLVCDLTYNPRQTALLSAAQQVGARTMDGTGMLVHQGAIAFEHWAGQSAPVSIMRQALLEALNQMPA